MDTKRWNSVEKPVQSFSVQFLEQSRNRRNDTPPLLLRTLQFRSLFNAKLNFRRIARGNLERALSG
jgi:hypothetical protein